MSSDIAAFLASCPVFSGMSPADMDELAGVFRIASHKTGTILLKQGGYSDGVYFLRAGRLAVRIQRGPERETVAMLTPPEIFGELSFLTGKQCVADVEVVVDSEIVYMPREAMPEAGHQREVVMRGLLGALATRLQVTMQRGATAKEPPVVLLRNGKYWAAPHAFATELVHSLARQTGAKSIVVNIGTAKSGSVVELADHTASLDLADEIGGPSGMRETLKKYMAAARGFHNVLLNVTGPNAEALADQIQDFANFHGYLLGPGDKVPHIPADEKVPDFMVQSADAPSLPYLSGSRQMIRECAESEHAFLGGKRVTDNFRRTVDSIARRISGTQFGVALGGGAAWGWAHIGVLETLEKADIPIDMITGCSMGSVIGSLYSAGYSTARLRELAEYWNTRTKRFIEWRFWRMCLVSDRAVRKVFTEYFGHRAVNTTDIPFWANAVDIEKGAEYGIKNGTLVDCVRSSIALPGLLPPHSVPPLLLVDAGIMNPVPAGLLRDMGSHFSIAINAMAEPGTTKISSGYPMNAFSLMTKCMVVMGHEIGQLAEQTANVVFTPDLSGTNMLQFARSAEIIERGRMATEERLPTILAGYQRLKDSVAPK